MIVTFETTDDLVGCPSCGLRAVAKDRLRVEIRDVLSAGSHPASPPGREPPACRMRVTNCRA
jgi:DNA-directed RNA polymerase subunit RPC12/RpoP